MKIGINNGFVIVLNAFARADCGFRLLGKEDKA